LKKNDKLIVVLGVVVLIIAAIGVYYWVPQKTGTGTSTTEDFIFVTGEMVESMPSAVVVADTCPFYPLIATPLTVNYNAKCEQHIKPLLIKNMQLVYLLNQNQLLLHHILFSLLIPP